MIDFPVFAAENSISFIENEPLSKHTSFKIGGPARYFVSVNSVDKLSALIKFLNSNKTPYFILGNGSNLLVPDNGYNGVVVKLSGDFENLEISGNIIKIGAAATLKKLTLAAKENSFTGVEFAYGIPGSVGGAIYMNAGAYGGEIKDVLYEVSAMDREGNVKVFSSEESALSYRSSVFQKNDMIILSASFSLEKGDLNEIYNKMKTLLEKR
jgi:UDP-N-acetylmuramate dehydrogenase